MPTWRAWDDACCKATRKRPESLLSSSLSRPMNSMPLRSPAGTLGVNTGLILSTQNESELASVLAHEISHVSQHHIARQIAGQAGNQVLSIAAMLGALIAAGTGNGQAAIAAMTGVSAAQIQSQINYTREHEQEGDRIGFQLLTNAGFDPRAMASFFERLQQATRLADAASIPSYLRTHPLTHERVAEAQDRAFSSSYKQVPDSQEYNLVRALLRSYEGQPQEAVARFTKDLQEGHYTDRNALRYGLTAAYLRRQNFSAAERELTGLERDKIHHPMIEALAGQVLTQSWPAQHRTLALRDRPEALPRTSSTGVRLPPPADQDSGFQQRTPVCRNTHRPSAPRMRTCIRSLLKLPRR